jgi:hypothetical protein
MLGKIVAVTLTLGLPMGLNAALAQSDAAVAAGVITGLAAGAAVATGAVPMEHREPLRAHIYGEPRPYYRYDDEVVVGGQLREGAYQSYPVPQRYAVVNNRGVVYHPQTRRIIHIYN